MSPPLRINIRTARAAESVTGKIAGSAESERESLQCTSSTPHNSRKARIRLGASRRGVRSRRTDVRAYRRCCCRCCCWGKRPGGTRPAITPGGHYYYYWRSLPARIYLILLCLLCAPPYYK